MTMERVYSGQLVEKADGEYDDALFVSDDTETPFAARFSADLNEFGRYVTVGYYVSDEPRTAEDLLVNDLRTRSGAAEADYTQHYSEYTGYLWTDEELQVGGHNLLAELSSNVGRYLHMTAVFHQDAASLNA